MAMESAVINTFTVIAVEFLLLGRVKIKDKFTIRAKETTQIAQNGNFKPPNT